MPGTRLKQPPKRGTKKRKKSFNPNALLAFLLLTLAALLVLMLVWIRRHPAQPERVSIGGQQVEIDESLPQSEVKQEEFTTEADGSVTYTGESLYGVDVSSHQGEVDWPAVAADGNDFAMLRIGYRGYTAGVIQQDPMFEANYTGAKDSGLLVGVYFFSQAVTAAEAEEEARQVLAWLEGKELDGPVAYDWETIENQSDARTNGLDTDTVTACASAFCTVIRQAGLESMIYCNGMLGYIHYDLSQLTDFPLWYAEYSDYPSFAYAFEMWQFTDTGAVDGISEQTDRNIWFRQEEEG